MESGATFELSVAATPSLFRREFPRRFALDEQATITPVNASERAYLQLGLRHYLRALPGEREHHHF
jgi:hypothetical protein